MKVLLSGGKKTGNIVDSIEKKFTASGDEFIVVEYMDDINDLFIRGDNFDKAIITEQSITREFTIKDEGVIRQRISNFVDTCQNRTGKYSYVFLTQNDKLANMIHEEILPIFTSSAVVLFKGKYTISFFTQLIRSDVKQLPSDIIFEPSDIQEEFGTTPVMEDAMPDVDISENQYEQHILSGDSDINSQIFGNDGGLGADMRVSDELSIDTGEELEIDLEAIDGIEEQESEQSYNDGQYNYNNMETQSEGDTGNMDNGYGGYDYGYGEQDVYTDGTVQTSGDIPNYVEPVENQYGYNQADQPLQGFDTDDDESLYGTSSSNTNEDLYGGNIGINEGDFAQSEFDSDDLYGNSSSPMTPVDPSSVDDLYSQNAGGSTAPDPDDMYNNNIEQQMYSPDEPATMGQAMGQTMGAGMAAGMAAGAMMGAGMDTGMPEVNNQLQPAKKKGLLGGLFGRNKQQQAPQDMYMGMGAQAPTSMDTSSSKGNTSGATVNRVKAALKPFASRGNSIMVTGCGGCGTSTIALNLANIIVQLGYSVLLVDFDTESKAQSYISKLNYDSMEPESSSLMSAVNSSTGINTHVCIVKPGFHLLTMGIAQDAQPLDKIIHKEKLSRFANLTKGAYNFVIYDAKFADAVGFLSEITFMTDNLVIVTDASNWGVTKTMLAVCNIDSDDMQEAVFGRAQLVFNRHRNLNRVLGNKVKTCDDITKVLDRKVIELMGEDSGYHFEDMHISGIIKDDPLFEDGWFEKVQYSDTKKGQEIFLEIVERIVLNK